MNDKPAPVRGAEFRRQLRRALAARSIDEARELMGMPWADWDGCRKAIPPAYTEHIGRQLLAAISIKEAQ